MQRNKVHAVTTLTKVAQDLEVSEDMLHDLTQQMDTEDGVIWVYGLEEEGVLALTEDGICGVPKLMSFSLPVTSSP